MSAWSASSPNQRGYIAPWMNRDQRPRMTRLIAFSEALSICQRASGFVPSMPDPQALCGIVQMAISHQRGVPERREPRKFLSHSGRLRPDSDGVHPQRGKGSIDPAAFQLFGGWVVLACHVSPIISSNDPRVSNSVNPRLERGDNYHPPTGHDSHRSSSPPESVSAFFTTVGPDGEKTQEPLNHC
jgi:hypothetical protein